MNIAIIGLGYVGFPLAFEFSSKYNVIGFDTDQERIEMIQSEWSAKENNKNCTLSFSNNLDSIKDSNCYIITVPTPIDQSKKPDLGPLFDATNSIGSILKHGDIVIFESTVFPGCTEEECVPILEFASGLKYNLDFFCGYSPERINVGDKVNTLTSIMKITSGSTPEVAEKVDSLYKSIIKAGTYKAPSIKVAEAAKSIENAQRDLNISFVNELALVFDKMGIDTNDVIDAAATKWNFIKFKPGLVGGHCIGVDPYYLTYQAEKLGYKPEVILSGRRVNENIAGFVSDKVLRLIKEKHKVIEHPRILILGLTFKENCDDIRNSRVIDLYRHLLENGCKVDVYDPLANPKNVQKEYSLHLLSKINDEIYYDGVILAVAHNDFLKIDYQSLKNKGSIIYDIKSFLPRHLVDGRL